MNEPAPARLPGSNDLGALFEEHARRKAELHAYYEILVKTKKIGNCTLAEIRCRRGCLLLRVFATPDGPAFHQSPYKLSREVNADESTASGRRANTIDGDRHWNNQTGLLENAGSFLLNCDHMRTQIGTEQIKLGAAGKPTRRVVKDT